MPFTLGEPLGATHVAGMNYGKPGQVARCIGCHSGHTMIPVPDNDEDAKWSNLAPGATVRASSSRNEPWNIGLVDRRAMKGDIWRTWASAQNNVDDQWVELVFPEQVTVRTVRLYNVRFEGGSTLQVHNATVRLAATEGSTNWIASAGAQAISPTGTDVSFPDIPAQVVRVEIDSASGVNSSGMRVVAFSEIEVIARAGGGTSSPPTSNTAPSLTILSPVSGASVAQGTPVAFAATASDQQDGDISSRIAWASNVDGPLGTGASLSKTLTAGTHQITASVLDTGGLSASKSVGVTVTASQTNTAPTVSIYSPASGSIFEAGTSVIFIATAADQQDGDLSPQINWTSSLDGPLGSGARVVKVLSPGVHQVTASARDSGGMVGSRTTGVTVNGTPTPTPPPPPPPPSGGFTLSGVSPNPIPSNRWARITITGSGFKEGATVSLLNGGSGPAPIVRSPRVVSATQMRVLVRPSGSGVTVNRQFDVSVRNGDGQTAVLSKGLTVLKP